MKKKGFTLVELLVVIAIIALLMGILMPALARVRQIAYRLYCGTNLSGIGKAILIYCNDYEDEMPRTYLPNPQLGVDHWIANIADYTTQLGNTEAFKTGASISSNFYLLVKYAEVTPKSFLCKSDPGTDLFEPIKWNLGDRDLVTLWDFGGTPQRHCSYSYHTPFPNQNQNNTGYSLTSQSDPGMAIAGDPNPWQNCYEARSKNPNPTSGTKWLYNGTREQIKVGNSAVHQDDGQNVLFVDGHTTFEKEPMCGVDSDNVYTGWGTAAGVNPSEVQRQSGQIPYNSNPLSYFASGRNDSFLMTDNDEAVTR